MSNISIGFCDFWPGFDVSHNVFIDILSKNFDVTINHKNPDFLFCSIFGNKSFKHHCTKILFMGENATPDFNIFDYALSLTGYHLRIGTLGFLFTSYIWIVLIELIMIRIFLPLRQQPRLVLQLFILK